MRQGGLPSAPGENSQIDEFMVPSDVGGSEQLSASLGLDRQWPNSTDHQLPPEDRG